MDRSSSVVDPQPSAAADARPRWWLGARQSWLAAALGLALAGGWIGGPVGLASVAAGSGLLAWMLTGRTTAEEIKAAAAPSSNATDATPPAPAAPNTTGAYVVRNGAQMMISQVVPVWSRQVALTRDAGNEGLSQLLDIFSQMAPTLDAVASGVETLAPTVEPGAVDQAVGTQSAALDTLAAASRRAFEQRDAFAAQLGRCAEAMDELRQIGKAARETARHTRLVAFNATIEANRGGSSDGGAKSVAAETRMLADRMAQAGERIDRLASRMAGELSAAGRDAMLHDTQADELRLEIDLHAREALAALLSSSGLSLQGSAAVREATQQLRSQLDAVFVQFQFGDRISQMLTAISEDMRKFAQWTPMHPHAAQPDAAAWLATLEASYTMEEQRSQHHGNVHIDRGSEVEFF